MRYYDYPIQMTLYITIIGNNDKKKIQITTQTHQHGVYQVSTQKLTDYKK